jgi:hypothetical protein
MSRIIRSQHENEFAQLAVGLLAVVFDFEGMPPQVDEMDRIYWGGAGFRRQNVFEEIRRPGASDPELLDGRSQTSRKHRESANGSTSPLLLGDNRRAVRHSSTAT